MENDIKSQDLGATFAFAPSIPSPKPSVDRAENTPTSHFCPYEYTCTHAMGPVWALFPVVYLIDPFSLSILPVT